MVIRLEAEQGGVKKDYSIFFTQLPFEPEKADFYIAIISYRSMDYEAQFSSKELPSLFEKISEYFNTNSITVTSILRPIFNQADVTDDLINTLLTNKL